MCSVRNAGTAEKAESRYRKLAEHSGLPDAHFTGSAGDLRISAHRGAEDHCGGFGNFPFGSLRGGYVLQFSLIPKGKYRISVCLGTACYVKGSDKILEEIEKQLGIKCGECTEDGLFSIDSCRCVGACGLAPVLMVNDEVYGKLTPDMVKGILDSYKGENK